MVPLVINSLSAMPLTANGKVDKKALLALDIDLTSSNDFVAPQDALEKKIASIFAEILNVEKVGIRDNFFEMGGHSLLATQLVSKIRNELEVELPLKVLFTHTNVESIKKYIQTTAKKAAVVNIEAIEERENLPLSFAQERLWFVDQLDPGSAEYNLPIAVKIEADLDLDKVEKALKMIIARHESLRSIFPSKEGTVEQHILEEIDFSLTRVDLSHMKKDEALQEAQKLAKAEASTAFDLLHGPLVRASVITLAKEEHILVINMHHIISDGWSIGILFKEFDFIMRGLIEESDVVLPKARIDYADYGVWQRRKFENGRLQKDLEYWEETLSPFPPKTNIAKLKAKVTGEDPKAIKTISQAIDRKLMEKLDAVRNSQNWNLNQVLLSVYASLIYRYTNQESMLIAVPNANRPSTETEAIIGFFVNTMLVKLDFAFSSSYAQMTAQVKDQLLDAIDHQDAPFQNIIEAVRLKENLNNLEESFQFSFNSLPMGELPKDESSPLSYEVFDIGMETATNLVVLTLDETKGTTDIQFAFKSALLDETSMQNFSQHFHTLLEAFCDNVNDLISLAPIFNDDIIEKSVYAKNEVKSVHPFTQIQTDMYLQGQVHFDNKYIIGWYYELLEELDYEAYEKTIEHVFSNVDTINLRHTQYDGLSYQMVLNNRVTDGIVRLDLQAGDDVYASIYKKAKEIIDLDNGAPVKVITAYVEGVLKYIAYMGHHAVMDGMSLASLKTLVDKSYKHYLAEGSFEAIEANTTISDISKLIEVYNPSQKEHWAKPLSKVESLSVFNASISVHRKLMRSCLIKHY